MKGIIGTISKLDSCPDCGKSNLAEKETEYNFQYGPKGHAVMLKTKHPVMTCGDCGCAFFDYRGESARAVAVNLYLDKAARRL